MSIESLTKFLELATKFVWPALAMVVTVLFLPDDLAKTLRLAEIRQNLGGYLWMAFVFLAVIVFGSISRTLWPYIWRLAICPVKKLLFPVRDVRTGIKQSRMRYYHLRMKMDDGYRLPIYQEIDSNGNVVRFMFEHGERFIRSEQYEANQINSGKFEFPSGARLDWSDVFNGDTRSGRWGISEF